MIVNQKAKKKPIKKLSPKNTKNKDINKLIKILSKKQSKNLVKTNLRLILETSFLTLTIMIFNS